MKLVNQELTPNLDNGCRYKIRMDHSTTSEMIEEIGGIKGEWNNCAESAEWGNNSVFHFKIGTVRDKWITCHRLWWGH